jgi:hypothetical protein
MLDAAYATGASEIPRRHLAITNIGSPLVYSHKSDHTTGPPPFRMLVEPGGEGRTVAEQVDFSSTLLCDVFSHFGWQRSVDQVEAVLRRLLPRNPDAFDDWRAGLGFGIEIAESDLEVRVYCNLWHGALQSRWRRLADAIAEFSHGRTDASVRAVLDRAMPRAYPVGVGLAVADGDVRGIRLYLGLVRADVGSAINAAPEGFADSWHAIRSLVETYRERFGALGRQDITLAYDFAIRGGILEPGPARFKVDLYCEPTSGSARMPLFEWAEGRVASAGMDAASLRAFVSDMDAAFSGATLQYVSLGCRHGVEEIAAYCIPGGWQGDG